MINKKISNFISKLDITKINNNRKKTLNSLINYIRLNYINNPIYLNFICTHNSRRSQLCQILFKTISSYYNKSDIFSYSGGTEVTEVYKTIILSLKNIGFDIVKIKDEINPIYHIKYDNNNEPILCFSKLYNSEINPTNNYIAVINCNTADINCPIVSGATKRFVIPFNDPKEYDGKKEEYVEYNNSLKEIARDLKYILLKI
ncbi:MAG: protein-tyrosine-phosphatase [Flavobacteriaceae bacterium]|nr:protein-tyrosine-phosphatase [Flavobacteriaceae bacterium]|tara:strand:- start:3973 stop:4578 length:606 start_codon:yes stop_codon:yes gene_type:complete